MIKILHELAHTKSLPACLLSKLVQPYKQVNINKIKSDWIINKKSKYVNKIRNQTTYGIKISFYAVILYE